MYNVVYMYLKKKKIMFIEKMKKNNKITRYIDEDLTS